MIPEVAADNDAIDIRHYLHVLIRHKWIVVASVLVLGALALGYSVLQTPIYSAGARVVLQSDVAETVFVGSGDGASSNPDRQIATEIVILNSKAVRERVAKKVQGNIPRVNATAVANTDVIALAVTDPDARRAAAVANAYADAYVDYRQQRSVATLLRAATEINAQINTLQGQADALDAQLGGRTTGGDDIRARRDSLIQQIGSFRQQLEQVQVQARLKEGGAEVVSNAVVPTAPFSPKPLRTTAVASVLGLLLGVGLALLREQLDDTIRTKDDVERIAKHPSLAIIPLSERIRDGSLIAIEEPSSLPSEAYRSLRTSIQFANLDGTMRIIEVTSANQGEGKTTTLANLAVTLAGAGTSVIVVCCDLRRPRVHETFGLTNKVGFTSVLLGDVALDKALQRVDRVPRLQVLASGPHPPNPSELLSHPRTGELLRRLTEQADIVLVDSPPLLPVTDALVLSRWTDGVAMVVTANKTSRHEFARSLELLDSVNAQMLGTVLNGMPRSGSRYGYGYAYGYGYGYGYTENQKPVAGDGKARKDREQQSA